MTVGDQPAKRDELGDRTDGGTAPLLGIALSSQEGTHMFKTGSGVHARRKRGLAIGACTALVVTGLVGGQALAAHSEVSLPGSNFEIDTDANLKVDDASPSIDWASVTELRQADTPTGQTDTSFGNGTKEDTEPPSATLGGVPNNKGDVLTFGGLLEENSNGRFLNLFWHRVQEPTGTTNMDFEFNQSSTISANGVTPVRTAGDVLIQYDLAQGGTNPTLLLSRWVTSGPKAQCVAANTTPCWGNTTASGLPPRVDLTAAGLATGSINTSEITNDPNTVVDETDGLGTLTPRTFGEAQINVNAFGDPTRCVGFGSGYLKSRSSDSFTAATKDYIQPIPINITNCGSVVIRKQTTPDEANNTTLFDYTNTIVTDPVVTGSGAFQLADDGVKTIQNVKLGTYTVTETAPSAASGYAFDTLDCSASTNIPLAERVVNGATVTFTINSNADILDCTYTNKAQANLHIIKTTDRATTQSFDFVATPNPPLSNFSLLKDGQKDFLNIAPGVYSVSETVPANWDLQSMSCDNGDNDPSNGVTLAAGSNVTCTFHNVIERGALVIHKDAKQASATNATKTVDLQGVTFTVTDENGAGTADDVVVGSGATNALGVLCIPNVPVSALDGVYTITETVPAGYSAVTPTQSYTVLGGTTCAGAGGTTAAVVAEFDNLPLTDITVSVNSQIVGGTASVISCTDGTNVYSASTSVLADSTNGDGSLVVPNRLPTAPGVTLTCTIVVDP